MTEQRRDDKGMYTRKSAEFRAVRSIRASDSTWNQFGARADERGITRADLLEEWAGSDEQDTKYYTDRLRTTLREALEIRGNKGNDIKQKVRDALALIEAWEAVK